LAAGARKFLPVRVNCRRCGRKAQALSGASAARMEIVAGVRKIFVDAA
jgi:hypothetical protein